MNKLKLFTVLLTLLLSAVLLLAGCDKTPADTSAPTQEATDPADGGSGTVESATDSEATDPAESATDEETALQIPEIDPEEAAAAGLPVDGDNYTVGGQDSAYDPAAQFNLVYQYAPCYADKTFTICGHLTEDENGNLVVSVGDGLHFPISFDGAEEPALGANVKLTATFTRTVSREDLVDFDCFTMIVTACEVLGEAVGPNGGKLMYITATELNVRTSSDTSSADNILGALYYGDLVEVFGQDEKGWYHIIFKGQDAYISYKYVSATRP